MFGREIMIQVWFDTEIPDPAAKIDVEIVLQCAKRKIVIIIEKGRVQE